MLADLFGLDAIWAIVIIAILIFGGAAIPKLARSLGSAKTSSRRASTRGRRQATRTPTSAATDRRRPRPRGRRRAPDGAADPGRAAPGGHAI